MRGVSATVRVYLYGEASDMRWSFERLSALAQQRLKKDPLSGNLFMFLNRRRDSMKVLYFEASGYCIWYKRLESGTFSILEQEEISYPELLCLLDGLEINKSTQKRRFLLRNSAVENVSI
jgi:transposase